MEIPILRDGSRAKKLLDVKTKMSVRIFFCQFFLDDGEPLWLSGKVVKKEKIN
jgi:hypothetical protein